VLKETNHAFEGYSKELKGVEDQKETLEFVSGKKGDISS
jgi:hypothetical protein